MKHSQVSPFVPFALGVCLATTSTACHRQSRADSEAQRAEAQAADSVRNARVEQSRSSATQAVSFDENERSRFTRVEQMIQAKFSGVTVTPRGNGFSIKIRGTASFSSSNEPLVLIDGVSRTTADLGGINPKDVDRIEVVKDAAASFYGSRGANGVIVITTRRGR